MSILKIWPWTPPAPLILFVFLSIITYFSPGRSSVSSLLVWFCSFITPYEILWQLFRSFWTFSLLTRLEKARRESARRRLKSGQKKVVIWWESGQERLKSGQKRGPPRSYPNQIWLPGLINSCRVLPGWAGFGMVRLPNMLLFVRF